MHKQVIDHCFTPIFVTFATKTSMHRINCINQDIKRFDYIEMIYPHRTPSP